ANSGASGFIGPLENAAILIRPGREERSAALGGPVLEAPLREDRHGDPRYRLDPRGHDFSLERIEAVVVPPGHFDERNRLGHGDDRGANERAEAGESR